MRLEINDLPITNARTEAIRRYSKILDLRLVSSKLGHNDGTLRCVVFSTGINGNEWSCGIQNGNCTFQWLRPIRCNKS